MCGIGGILCSDDQPTHAGRMRAMLTHLAQRGPDAQQAVTLGRCTLAHARLSIIDPATGAQPMQSLRSDRHGPLCVVYNGMIYNHHDLRRKLQALGHHFRSHHSDTEVLLHGYRQWGCALAAHLDGFFAFAIWDQTQGSLFLARDRMGKKPLYFSQTSNEFVFASLISALVAANRSIRINHAALLDYLHLGYTFDISLLHGIEQLPAGHYMTVDIEGQVDVHSYAPQPELSDDRELPGALQQAVAKRLQADVPLGCFLSGGIDSSIVAALAQQVLRAQGGDALDTFHIAMPGTPGSPGNDFDESDYAQQVAAHISSRHRRLVIEPGRDAMSDLEQLIGHMGEPTADSSLLPTYWVSRAAREHVKVALTGDGGDELFGGYDRYRAMRFLEHHSWWLRHWPVRPHVHHPHSLRTRLHRLAIAAGEPTAAAQYGHIMHLFTDDQLRQLGLEVSPSTWQMPDWPAAGDPAEAAMQWDLQHYLPHDLLRKVDRASMAAGLEVRCPMLDGHVVALAGRLSTRAKLAGRRQKIVLRQLAAKLLPQRIASRPKRGFAIPIGQWFCHEWKDSLAQRIFDSNLHDLGLQKNAIEKLYQQHIRNEVDHTHRLFALLGLSIWQRGLRQ